MNSEHFISYNKSVITVYLAFGTLLKKPSLMIRGNQLKLMNFKLAPLLSWLMNYIILIKNYGSSCLMP